MKQNITKEQWNELSVEEEIKIMVLMSGETVEMGIEKNLNFWIPINIGQMIEFLDKDLGLMEYAFSSWVVKTQDEFQAKELCDALWEAVKYKLKQS